MGKTFDRGDLSRQSGDMRILSLIFGLALFALSPLAQACSCMAYEGTVEDFVDETDVIFYGLVTDVQPLAINGQWRSEDVTTFRVMRAYTGLDLALVKNKERKIDVRSRVSSSACGMSFKLNAFYLVRATNNAEGILTTNLCQNGAISDLALYDYLTDRFGYARGAFIDEANVEQELCYVKIKQAYDAQLFTGRFELDDKNCQQYIKRYDSIYRVKHK